MGGKYSVFCARMRQEFLWAYTLSHGFSGRRLCKRFFVVAAEAAPFASMGAGLWDGWFIL
jgi:hypothetical protein